MPLRIGDNPPSKKLQMRTLPKNPQTGGSFAQKGVALGASQF
jgi:hypothetical protein